MNLINTIVLILALVPIIWVISDLKKGKIKNIFIFPYFLFLIIFTFFIKDFYIYSNIIQLVIIFIIGYIFYIYNKWWAGDWKYIIVLWLSIVIIWYLKWINLIIINFLTTIFLIISLIIIWYLLLNIKKIIKLKKINLDIWYLDTFVIFNLIFILSSVIKIYFNNDYTYIFIFLLLFIMISIYHKIKFNNFFKYILILLWLVIVIYEKNIYWYFITFLIFITFLFISKVLEDIFTKIDLIQKNIFDLKQGDILSENSLSNINKSLKSNYVLSPLQWNEVYEIISYYKEKNNNIVVDLYKDIKIWIYIYIWFILTILYIYLK